MALMAGRSFSVSGGASCLVLSSGGGLLQELTPSDLGARLLQQALEKISERLGDGICLTALLSHSLVREGARLLMAGIDPLRLRAELEDLSAQALAELRRSAQPVPSLSEAIRLCCGAWEEAAGLLTEAFQGVSQEGIVTVRDAKSQTSFVKILGDVEIDQGYLSPAMITDPRSCESVVEEPLVLLTDQLIASAEQIVPALTIAQKAGRPLFVMAQDVTGEALATIALNNRRKKVFALAVKATAYGERRKEILQDIAVLTRSQVISSDLAMSLENITPQQLGTAQWIRSVPGHTYIGGSGDPEAVRRRVIQLRWEIQTALYEVDRVNLRNRLARLTGGVAIIYAGAPTEAEMRAKRHKD